MFVTFEGLDGSGKTTQVALLRKALEADGREVVVTREPGGTAFGEEIRNLVLHGPNMSGWAETALFTAARAELAETVIRPALARGADVVCDRYLDSSLAYQGIARGLGLENVLNFNLAAIGDVIPDVTFVLLLEPAAAATRYGGRRDRMEREDDEFRLRVDEAYRQLAALFPHRIVAIDGASPPEEIADAVVERLRQPA